MFKKFNLANFLILWALVFYLTLLLSTAVKQYGEQHFAYLSHSFLRGRLDMNDYTWARDDNSFYQGNYYWPLGIFPAIFLTPFAFIFKEMGFIFLQKDIHWILVLAVFCLIYKISRKFGYSKRSSVFLSFAFNVGSVFLYISIVPFSWYFSQVITVLLIFAAFFEYLNRRRYWIIGVLYALIFLTRATAVLGILVYALSIVFLEKDRLMLKFRKLLILSAPLVFGVAISSIYNFLRFGSVFEQGYSYQILGEELIKARSYGMLGLVHLPGNLYYLLFASPLPVLKDGLSRVLVFPYIKFDIWGMGIFYTSPYLLNLFTFKYKDVLSKILLLVSIVTALPILLYYGIGVIQYGYRYSLDFLPYLFLIFLINLRNRKSTGKIGFVIILSMIFNLYLIFSRSYLGRF